MEHSLIVDGTMPEPHILQKRQAPTIAPTGWTVDEIILTESIVGKTTHVEHGRWPLRGGTS